MYLSEDLKDQMAIFDREISSLLDTMPIMKMAPTFLFQLIQLQCLTGFSMNGSPYQRYISTSRSILKTTSTLRDSNTPSGDEDESNPIKQEIERLQQQLTYIGALEERNKAQLDSFVDEKDQWDSMEEDERQLLLSKTEIEMTLEQMTTELVTMWLGGKSMEG